MAYTYKKCVKCLGYNGTSMKMCSKCRTKARKYVKKMYGPTKR